MSLMQSATVLFICSVIALSNAANTWIVQSDIKPEDLPPSLTRESSHELLLKLLSKKNESQLIFELRSEFYTMATGKDFYKLTADDNENKEYHAIAEASLILSQKLHYMTHVNSILRRAIANAAKTVQKEGDITKALPSIKETVEKLMMQESPALNEEYKRLKSEALAKPLPSSYSIYYYEIPKTLDDAKKILADCLNDPYLKKLMVHSSFGSELRPNASSSHDSVVLAKTILELSKDAEVGSKVQALYDEVIAEAANKVEDVTASNVDDKHVKDTFVQIAKDLFKALADKFENDPTIKTKFTETKAKIASRPADPPHHHHHH